MPPLSLKSLRVALKGSSSTKTADEPAENGAAEGDPAQALEVLENSPWIANKQARILVQRRLALPVTLKWEGWTVCDHPSGTLKTWPCLQAPLHPDAHEEGGLLCNNEALLKEQRE